MEKMKGVVVMLSRPMDDIGDILPVLTSADLLSGISAVASGLRDYMHLYQGDRWENPEMGNAALDLMADARATDREAETLASYLSSYILEFPPVRSVSDVAVSFSGHVFHFSCTAHTEEGEVPASLSL